MNPHIKPFKQFTRLAVVVCLGMSVAAWAADNAAGAAPAKTEAKQDRAKHRQEMIKRMTERMAARLEIKASQQGAWQAYTKTLEAAFAPPPARPEGKTDAASMTRAHAEMAALRAQKLAQIADATAKLQEVLTPDQRTTLNQMVEHAMRRHMGHRHGFGEGREAMEHEHGHDGEGRGHGDHAEHGGQWDHHQDGHEKETEHN